MLCCCCCCLHYIRFFFSAHALFRFKFFEYNYASILLLVSLDLRNFCHFIAKLARNKFKAKNFKREIENLLLHAGPSRSRCYHGPSAGFRTANFRAVDCMWVLQSYWLCYFVRLLCSTSFGLIVLWLVVLLWSSFWMSLWIIGICSINSISAFFSESW